MTQSGDARPPRQSELATRILAAVILAPVALACAWAGGIWFAILVGIAIAIGGHEWARLCRLDHPMSVALMIGAGPLLGLAFVTGGVFAGLIVLVLAALSAFGGSIRQASMWPIIGVIYLGIPILAVLALRADPRIGYEGLFFLLGVVWLTDIGAYAAGRLIGGPRLAPAISPGKTWAGAVGGLVVAMAGGYWGAGFMSSPLPTGAIGLAVCLSLATQCGDLFESWVKRRFDAKDSGTLIPGHGGILDRIDGLLFAAPVMAAITFIQ